MSEVKSRDGDRIKDAYARYTAAMHAVQSAVAYEQGQRGLEPSRDPDGPKHLRVGVSSALIDMSAIAGLLIRKGVFTEIEYVEALAEAAEREVNTYEDKHPGIKFG